MPDDADQVTPMTSFESAEKLMEAEISEGFEIMSGSRFSSGLWNMAVQLSEQTGTLQ